MGRTREHAIQIEHKNQLMFISNKYSCIFLWLMTYEVISQFRQSKLAWTRPNLESLWYYKTKQSKKNIKNKNKNLELQTTSGFLEPELQTSCLELAKHYWDLNWNDLEEEVSWCWAISLLSQRQREHFNKNRVAENWKWTITGLVQDIDQKQT